MLCTPSQQAQESWHKQILQSRIPGMFKGSTEHVMHVALPQLVAMDAALIPDVLLFSVPDVPSAMLTKASWYISHRATNLFITDDDDEEEEGTIIYTFYLLAKAASKSYRKVDGLLVTRYCSLLHGERPRGLTKLEAFIDVANALHVVEFARDGDRKAPLCQFNPAELVCNCPGFRLYGICSHCIACNHWLGKIDVLHLMGGVATERRKSGGFRQGVRPALEQEEQAQAKFLPKKRRLK